MIFIIYRFYRYYKKTDFREAPPVHFFLGSFTSFMSGVISMIMFVGISFLIFLPFVIKQTLIFKQLAISLHVAGLLVAYLLITKIKNKKPWLIATRVSLFVLGAWECASVLRFN